MIAEQFRTKLFSENFVLRSYCYKGTYLFNEEYTGRDYSTVLFYIIGNDRCRLYTRFSLIGVSFIDFIQIREKSDNPLFFLLRLDVHMNIARYVLRSTKLDLLHKTLACDGCDYSKVVILHKETCGWQFPAITQKYTQ